MGQEKNFENKIKKYLSEKDCYFVKYFANRMTKVGIPDILACVNGYFIGIEVKSENGKPSDLQKYNVKKIQAAGGFGVIVRPSEFERLTCLICCLMEGMVVNARVQETTINVNFFTHDELNLRPERR